MIFSTLVEIPLDDVAAVAAVTLRKLNTVIEARAVGESPQKSRRPFSRVVFDADSFGASPRSPFSPFDVTIEVTYLKKGTDLKECIRGDGYYTL